MKKRLIKYVTRHPSLWEGLGGLLVLLLVSCARMGSPDGGWYDETPPYVVSSTPQDRSTGVDGQRIVINFNEYIKLQDAQSKVIVSPPQLEMPEIKDNGKRIIVELKDSLKANTTYTIDCGDAISDFTESNPMGNYAFTFSTGSQVDTLEVAGYVLSAENLEPVKDILVGLYQNLADSDLSVETVGAELGLSRVQLYRKVKALTGLSPVELLRKARLQRGLVLLQTTDKTISEVAYEVGFTAPSYFTKCFRDEYGIVPGESRK